MLYTADKQKGVAKNCQTTAKLPFGNVLVVNSFAKRGAFFSGLSSSAKNASNALIINKLCRYVEVIKRKKVPFLPKIAKT